jgi:hypothetical protein
MGKVKQAKIFGVISLIAGVLFIGVGLSSRRAIPLVTGIGFILLSIRGFTLTEKELK